METKIYDKLHVAIIMDGNGRWAEARGLPRSAGHRAGAHSVARVVEASAKQGIAALTLYAFSSDNWQRPATEVSTLFGLFDRYLRTQVKALAGNGIRLSVIGRRDRLATSLLNSITRAERETAGGKGLHLRIAIDYSSRHEMARALQARTARGDMHDPLGTHDVDLLIRTGGEQRLSDFMLWECAYAELLFTPVQWPDFDETALASALRAFSSRQRRFGGLASTAA
ncbi:MAG: di-trans,poly-cis-decaprenylcistransferase [Hyphomicrobiaceae bacterium]|nr:di-trans,poly-cis-decaprenylcistransferase [Hyphomicrobiaceae bacterium]